jgi:NCAIR mutase (PurE)-related protein
MTRERLHSILTEVAEGKRPVDEALMELRRLPYEDLGFARLDHHRALRKGFPEVVFGEGKTPDQVAKIVDRLIAGSGQAIVTRTNAAIVEAVRAAHPSARFFEMAHLLAVGEFAAPPEAPFVAVVTGGTSDMPVAEEAAITLELLGTRAVRVYDAGTAGLHRLLDQLELLWQAIAVVAVAGMEGALATVLGGLVSSPVIAVPTSVGYGASFDGLAALLAMMNSCAPGVAVVNIDNGFGAAVFAHMIAAKA